MQKKSATKVTEKKKTDHFSCKKSRKNLQNRKDFIILQPKFKKF